MRALEDQFDPPQVARIRAAAARASALRLPDGVSRYYRSELVHVLEAGALLGALHVAASLLELAIRGVLVRRARDAVRRGLDLEQVLEEKRSVSFYDLVRALTNAGFLDPSDAALAESFYREVRIPILHGLVRRFVTVQEEQWRPDFRALLRADDVTMCHEFEGVVEDRSLEHVEAVLGILERNLA